MDITYFHYIYMQENVFNSYIFKSREAKVLMFSNCSWCFVFLRIALYYVCSVAVVGIRKIQHESVLFCPAPSGLKLQSLSGDEALGDGGCCWRLGVGIYGEGEIGVVEEDGGVVCDCFCYRGGGVDGGLRSELCGGADLLWLGPFLLCGLLPSWETR